jgi:probable nitrogen fixation protein
MRKTDLLPTIDTTDGAFDALFLRSLIDRVRAEDSFAAWEGKPDEDVLADYIVTRQQRREIPIIDDPDPDTVDRVGYFYQAVGLAVERHCGVVTSPMMTVHHEGFGRVVLIAGHLVAFARTLRDIHRFGFDSISALAAAGGKVVAEAEARISAHPDVACS